MKGGNIPIEFHKQTVYDILSYLESAPISLEEVFNVEPIPKLLNEYEIKRAFATAEDRVRKWVSKRGGNISKIRLQNLSYGFLKKAMLEVLYMKILSHYGIRGPETLNYTSLGYKVAKASRKLTGRGLVDEVNELMKYHKERKKVDEKILKVIVLATLKLLQFIERNYSDIIFKVE